MKKYRVALFMEDEEIWNCEEFDTREEAQYFFNTALFNYYIKQYNHYMGENIDWCNVKIVEELQ